MNHDRRDPQLFAGLLNESLWLTNLSVSGDRAAVNLLVPNFAANDFFAGVATALRFAGSLAVGLGRPLRILLFRNRRPTTLTPQDVANHLVGAGYEAPEVVLVRAEQFDGLVVSPSDVWIPTFWRTAHAVDVACRVGLVEPTQVAYLVQDYEPGFSKWSDDFAIAKSTYHAGFTPIVNSRPLARYLETHERSPRFGEYVLEPDLDLVRLENAAARRRPNEITRVLFYSRPGVPRNLFRLGAAVLRTAAATLAAEKIPVAFVMAGQEQEALSLGPNGVAVPLGKMGWEDYFELLATIDVGFGLMYSPHPSHPPLEVAVSGGFSVTNSLEEFREGLHPRIRTAAPEVSSLADALVASIIEARTSGPMPFEPPARGSLGDPLPDVVSRLAEAFGGPAPTVVGTHTVTVHRTNLGTQPTGRARVLGTPEDNPTLGPARVTPTESDVGDPQARSARHLLNGEPAAAVGVLNNHIQDLNVRLGGLEREMRDKTSRLESRLHTAVDQREQFRAEIRRLREETRRLRHDNGRLEREKDRLGNEIAAAKATWTWRAGSALLTPVKILRSTVRRHR